MNDYAQKETKQKNGGFTMFKKIRKQLKNEKGLTLVELLAVIVILGIIAAIAVPAIGNIITNSKYNAAKADALNVLNAAQMYYLDNPDGEESEGSSAGEKTDASVSIEGLEKAGYLESMGVFEEKKGNVKVTLATPHAFASSNATVEFSNGKNIDFGNATIDLINKDNEKGSKINSTHKIVEE